jgi:small-conductance mechanosensitive channel
VSGIAPEVLAPLAAAVAVTAAALILRAVVLKRLIRVAGESGIGRAAAVSWDGRLASLLLCVAVGLWGGLEAASLPSRLTARLEALVQALVIATATIAAAAFLASALDQFGHRQGLTIVLTGLSQTIIRICVVVVGALVLLSQAGIAITPLVTALGIGGLAAALALQDTLSNLFGGFHLLADQPIRVGDLIRLENGMEGVVEDIGWRSTRIRSLSKELIVVPNAKLAQSILTNCSSATALHERSSSGTSSGSGTAPWSG